MKILDCLFHSIKNLINFRHIFILIEAAKGYGIEIATLKEFDENKVGSFLYNIAMMAGYNQYGAIFLNIFVILYVLQLLFVKTILL